MTQIMTPSTTIGQIDKAVANYRAMLEKHAHEFSAEAVQTVLGQSELAGEQFAVFRKRVEMASKMVVRHFKVDRTKTPAGLLAACKRVPWYIDEAVLANMPMDGPEEGDLVFFPLERNTPVADISRALDEQGLIPDYAAQMQVNADDPAFADEHPNGMQWGGKNSYACFRRFSGERKVSVDRNDHDWGGDIWFAGRRKVSSQS
ncbi:MAG: hypothetical protein UR80_C0039G0003 [Parcubacteria group bacterium GW2011_GWB1_35_5]|nr:MAG: hypothetical protein UR80_C0039G0003 [Parcubacteria group bacterium GW2011_GWB1_35_5]